MKHPVTVLMMLALTTAAAISVATVAPQRRDECLNLVAQVRLVNAQQQKVTANVGWTCEPKLLAQGLAKMSINGYPAGRLTKVDSTGRYQISAIVPRMPLPVKVCVSLDGRGSDGIPVTALQCESVDSHFIDLPQPIRMDLQTYPSSIEPIDAGDLF